MSLTARLRSFLSALAMRRRMEREMDDEWQFHLDARVDDLVATGLSRADAERTARREFGDVLRWKEDGREARGLRVLGELSSVRGGVRHPRFGERPSADSHTVTQRS